MTQRRNTEGLTPAAARVVARTSPRFGQWGVEKRLRDQVVAEGLATVEWHGRESKLRLTARGVSYRAVYRQARLHRLPREPWVSLTAEQRRECLEAAGSLADAAAAILSLV